jgi:N-acyl-D-amino-acid deacylase
MYDIIFRDAKIVDGSGQPAVSADIAVAGPKIAEVGSLDEAEAKTIVDAAGKVITPGFIDIHSHADFSLPVLPTAESLIHQGITTVVIGQCGLSPAPLLSETREKVVSALCGFFGDFAKAIPWAQWNSFEDYLNFLEHIRITPNVVPLVGHGMIRAGIVGYGEEPADDNQMARMKTELSKALDQGAIGMSTGLIYPPGAFVSTEELIELTKVVGARNGYYFSHIRGENETLLEAVAEAVRIGKETNTKVQISHFKAGGKVNWDKSEKAIALLHKARKEGLDVSADLYPYRAGSTALAALLPQWAHVGGPAETLKRLADRNNRTRMKRDMQTSGFVSVIEWKDVLITSAPHHPRYEGRYISELAETANKSGFDWLFEALLQSKLDMFMAVFGMSAENRYKEITFAGMMIGTDGFGLAATGPMAKGVPHPRNYGTFPRVLARYVRELKILTMEEAIYKMTGQPAAKLRLFDRGMLKPGLAADLVMFDPATVSDKATYKKPHQYAEGIGCVMVNGEFAVRDAVHTAATPGKVLKPDHSA